MFASALIVSAAAGLVTWVTLDLEERHFEAEALANDQTDLLLALWKLDSYVAPLLAQEAARPWYHYQPFVPEEQVFTRLLQKLDPGAVFVASPLLGERSPWLSLHFELSPSGEWSSPQAPVGNYLDLAQDNLGDPEFVETARQRLVNLQAAVSESNLREQVEAGEVFFNQVANNDSHQTEKLVNAEELLKNQQRGQVHDYGSRAGQQWRVPQNVQTLEVETEAVDTGPFVPLWVEIGGDQELVYLRRVRTQAGDHVQGFLTDWRYLHQSMLASVIDLAPGAHLVPEPLGSSDNSLATLPAKLVMPEVAHEAEWWTPTKTSLAGLWVAAFLVVTCFGFALRATIAYGEKRARFASAVTHELRTPLTTFRMYSEMLRAGIVPPERQEEYLDTLKSESDRLSGLVENVLSYARLEDGRNPVRPEPIPIDSLVERVYPNLARHAESQGESLELDLQGEGDTKVRTDVDAVQQILFNLVDNACKYGESPITLRIRANNSEATFDVEDRGPGIPRPKRRTVFRPFDRGGRDEADPNRGVGLGLALSRGLARDLSGDLVLEDAADAEGARFQLRLPRA